MMSNKLILGGGHPRGDDPGGDDEPRDGGLRAEIPLDHKVDVRGYGELIDYAHGNYSKAVCRCPRHVEKVICSKRRQASSIGGPCFAGKS